MCIPIASAVSITPIRIRKLNASIFTVGFASMNPLIRSAKTSITPTAMMIAVAITQRSSAIPTAVITESSENTTSSNATCIITLVKLTALPVASDADSPSIVSCTSCTLLPIKNKPPTNNTRSCTVKLLISSCNTPALSCNQLAGKPRSSVRFTNS